MSKKITASSDISCTVCNKSVGDCECPETDATLKEIAFNPENKNVMMKWCVQCDRHYARCTCAHPRFRLICAGQTVLIPKDGFRTAAGTRIVPNLEAR